jgi:hypothetical protein
MNTKNIVVIAVAVVLGIWVYRMLVKGGKVGAVSGKQDVHFEGPDIDPQTGAYLGPGARPGTVEQSPMGN